jgi:hypothetical protein
VRPGTGSIQRRGDTTTLIYRPLGCTFHVQCEQAEMARAVDHVYREMACPPGEAPRVMIEIRGPSATGEHELLFDGVSSVRSPRTGDIIHQLDNELSIHLAHARPDLYFVHGGVLARQGEAILLPGVSGAGKSTLTYALASAGLEYLSDEIAGIEPATGLVHPYPRAICLKREPPAPLTLPSSGCLRTEWTLHVAARSLSARVATGPSPLGKVFFVRYAPSQKTPAIRSLSAGEAALRLYQNALNQLAHPECGLDSTLKLVREARCYELLSAGIEDTVRAVLDPPEG